MHALWVTNGIYVCIAHICIPQKFIENIHIYIYNLSRYPAISPSFIQSINQSIYLSVYLSILQSIYLFPCSLHADTVWAHASKQPLLCAAHMLLAFPYVASHTAQG